MFFGGGQVGRWRMAAVIALLTSSIAHAGRWEAQLQAECLELISAAEQRRYGWAWGEPGDASRPRERGEAVEVDLHPTATPGAALVLHLASQFLEDPRLAEAAREAARGIAAVQEQTGRVPSRGVFGAGATGRQELSAVPERGPTCAAIGVWSLIVRSSPDERLKRSTHRALFWLIKQQTKSGLWLDAYPPDAEPGEADRIVWLDEPGYRDATLALMLGGIITENKPATVAAEKAVGQLLKLRIEAGTPAIGGLWRGAYGADGLETTRVRRLPRDAASLKATRHAMQTLLAMYLMGGRQETGMALDQASQTVWALRSPNGIWASFYNARGQAIASTRPATTQPAEGVAGLEDLVISTRTLKHLGRDRYLDLLGTHFDIEQEVALLLCGVTPMAGSSEVPVTRAEVDGYIEQESARWALLDGPPPGDLEGRVRRLGLLLWRARLERLRGSDEPEGGE